MRLEKASHKAIVYSCRNYHYSKVNPNSSFGYSVFNNEGKFCGVVLYGVGANNNIGSPYGLVKGQIAELVRVALNGMQSKTTNVLSKSRLLFKRDNPTVKMLISFADTEQNHKGIIYQADNWFYVGDTISADEYLFRGKRWHGRAFRSQFGSHVKYKDEIEIIRGSVKHRYIYPLDKSLIPLCKSLSKPYPKQAQEVKQDKRSNTITEIGGSSPTLALKINSHGKE